MTTYSDNFNRSNSTSLGSPWVDVTGGWGVLSNGAYTPNNADNFSYYNNTTANDQYSKATFVNLGASGTNDYIGVGARISAGPTGYMLYVNPLGAGWVVQAAPSFSTIMSGSDTFTSGDTVELRAVGTTITFYKNSVSIGSTTDASIASGFAGLDTFTGNDTARTWFDNWEGGDVGGGGGATYQPYMNYAFQPTVAQ